MSRFTLHRLVPFLLFCAALLASPGAALGQSPFSSVKMDVALSREGAEWKGEARFNIEGKEIVSPLLDLKIGGDEISFTAKIEGADVRFKGRLDGGKLGGSLEAFEKESKVAGGAWSLTRVQGGGAEGAWAGNWAGTFSAQLTGEQTADASFDVSVARPAYVRTHPRVLFDEAHNNFHTTTGRYKPFADLIRNDGYSVTANREKFSAKTLAGYDVLVISNALGPRGQRASAAFTEEECDAVREWVRAGGSLLLIADHAPMGAAAEILSQRFGVEMSKGYTIDPTNYDKSTNEQSQLVFTRENGLLGEHAITKGRSAAERVNRVVTFTGQSLRGPAGSSAILRLGDTARDQLPGEKKEVSAAGRAQAVALKFGKGRAVVLAEAAMLTAQVSAEGEKFGMNVPGTDDRQFALNVMHWLSGLLK